MNPYKLVIAYDGTNYHGWQEQAPGVATVATVLQDSFKKVFGHEIKVVGASRTDAGVHALGQVARFYTSLTINPKIIRKSWNASLPNDIQIRSLEPIVDEGRERIFHPQHNVHEKIYQYHFCSKRPLPFLARFVHFHTAPLDIQKMRDCLQSFVGEHNFSSFCAEGCKDDTVCTVKSVTLEYIRQYNIWRVTVRGKRFLHHMVRRMVGAALKIACDKKLSPHEIVQALEKPGVYSHLPTVAAQGLVLRKIIHER